jgi:multiple RNA-binding domain-containing protein 1
MAPYLKKNLFQIFNLKLSGDICVRNLTFLTVVFQIVNILAVFEPNNIDFFSESNHEENVGAALIHFSSLILARDAYLKLQTYANEKKFFAKMVKPRKNLNGCYMQMCKNEKKALPGKGRSLKNTLFLRQDTVLEAIATEYNLNKKDLLNCTLPAIATSIAIGEAWIKRKTKESVESEGVNWSILERATSGYNPITNRHINEMSSKSIILVKNLPYKITKQKIKSIFDQFGPITKFVLPVTRSFALVRYRQVASARIAFRSLAYHKFLGVPLYLQWVPKEIFGSLNPLNEQLLGKKSTRQTFENNCYLSKKTHITHTHEKKCSSIRNYHRNLVETENKAYASSKLMIKNLPLEIKRKDLIKNLQIFGQIVSCRMPKKKDGGLRGFAFVEMLSSLDAKNLLTAINHVHFYGKNLVVDVVTERSNLNA